MKTLTQAPHRRLALSEANRDAQIKRGLYLTERGEPFAIPVDDLRHRETYQHRELWRQDAKHGVHRPGVRFAPVQFSFQKRTLGWLRDHVHPSIPRLYYTAALGHDLHVSTWAELYARQFHAGWANPFEPDKLESPIDPTFRSLFATHYVDHECDLPVCPRDAGITLADLPKYGFVENLGLLSQGKVTKAFVNVQVGAQADAAGSGEAAEFNDFNEHEVGTATTAEANTQTALTTSSGIALAAGTQVDSGGDPPIYTTVATITADATETWEEHGVFSTTTDTLLDRSLTGGQSVNSSDQVQYTFAHTVNPEA